MADKKFEELTLPLVTYLQENFHPHVKVIVTPRHAELVEGLQSLSPHRVEILTA